jgi:hypothetical protein
MNQKSSIYQAAMRDDLVGMLRNEIDTLRASLRELLERERWIPVEERLPGEHVVVWAAYPRSPYVIEAYLDHGDWRKNLWYKDGRLEGVTHWMEIFVPAPPESEG